MTDPYSRTPEGMFDRILQRIGGLETRLARGITPPQLKDVGRGTTAERDALFGDPALFTTPEKVALANRRIVWFNVDVGWEESFYAPAGWVSQGLVVPGLISGATSGWYPTGPGPRAVVRMTAAQAQTNGQQLSLWSFAVDGAYRRGGAAWFELFDSNKTLRVKRAGRYRFDGRMSFPNGTGTGVCSWRGNMPTGLIQFPVPLLSGYGQYETHSDIDLAFGADYGIYFQTDSASWSIGGGNSYMSLTYLGPLLATD